MFAILYHEYRGFKRLVWTVSAIFVVACFFAAVRQCHSSPLTHGIVNYEAGHSFTR